MLIVIVAAIAAGLLATTGPGVLSRLPEPSEPDPDKTSYADLATAPHLAIWLGVSAAAFAGIVALVIDVDWLVPAWVVFAAAGVLLAYIDWNTKLLPRLIVLPLDAAMLVLVALAALLEDDWSLLRRAVILAVIVFVIFWLSNFVFPRGLGYGDVRLSFGLALPLGALGGQQLLVGVYAGFLIGAVGAIILSRLRIVDAHDFAFGPYLVLGAFVGAIWGPSIGNLLG